MIAALVAIVAQLNISVVAPDTAELGDIFSVKVLVRSPSLLPPSIVPPAFAGFALMGSGDVSNVHRDSTSSYITREADYRLVARTVGVYTIGSFETTLDNKTLRSPPFKVVIREPRRPVRMTMSGQIMAARGEIDTTKSVSIAVSGTPDTVFVGQQATYQVAVFVDENLLRQRTARSPTFTPPDLRGTLSYELSPSSSLIPSRQIGGRIFRPHVYQRAIFPLVPGNHVVPAAMLDYSVPAGGAIFSKEETHSLRADSVVIVARPLPTAGRPSDFSGAVGAYAIQRSISGSKMRVGDPFTLRIRVMGTGNIKLLPRPVVDIPWADVLTAGERIELRLDDGRVGGGKEFEWVVTPRKGGPQILPALRYSYFDPQLKRYQVALAAAESLMVVPGSLLATDDSVVNAKTVLPIRRSYHGEKRAPLSSSIVFLVVGLLAPIPPLLAIVRSAARRRAHSRKERAPAPSTYAAFGTQKGIGGVSGARRVFLSSVEDRLGLRRGISATEGGFRSALLRSGVSRETTAEAEQLIRDLDAAVFGAQQAEDNSLIESAARCFRKIDSEAANVKTTRMANHAVPVIVLLCAAFFAQATGTAEHAFARGVEFYSQGLFSDAATQFLEITRGRPRAPDAWVNLGAAAWEGADTAAAMVAWQRALRLDPTARDVRNNIDLMPQSGSRDASLILAVSPDVVAIIAMAAWIATCVLAYIAVTKKGSRALIPLVACTLLAIVLGAATLEINRRINDRSIAVVTHDVISHALPSLEAANLTRLSPGEVVRLTQTERDWSRVELDGRHAGWLHHSDLLRIVVE